MSYYGPSSPDPRQPNPYQSGSYGWNPQGGAPQPPQNYHPGFMPVAQPGTLPLRPLSLGDYFNSLFTTLRKSPGLFFGAALLFGGLAAILTATGEFLLSRSMGNLGTMDPYAELGQAMDGFAIWILVSMLLAQIATAFGYVFTWGIYSTMVGRGAVGMKTSLGQGFRLLRGQWGRLIGLTLLIFAGIVIATVITALFVGLFVYLFFSDIEPTNGGAIIGMLFMIFALLLLPLIPVLYFMTRWCLVAAAMIVEDIGPFAAMRRSWSLTRGNFWRTFGIGVLFTIIVSIVQGVILTPLMMFSSFAILGAGTEAEFNLATVIVNTIISAISTLITFVIYNMLAIVTNALYYDYRFRKEGLHLEFQQLAAQYSTDSTMDRFDTSPDQRPSSFDETNLVLPGRHSVGMQQSQQPGHFPQSAAYPAPYGQQPPQPPQGPPQPPGPYQ
ncbi:MAG: glycerophosphoryl diester phosphodiesterase membrane domain-containing protein [Yaniella sp.]|uniref:glycerophosphoryl diester phosphodiesterase membrane domain-containing protein n=1 Tax=Yaniella sp. TaxID=2773929 RepID=UPI00264918BB|nr:glycerophosphoryl diester phosphodiesterase membrane domain-containing protein [Yaniella sp.]MDN5837793.1 glycerophosphoryl diester phosphodiesterase membrane domain-containing protein [Yaniella sp.]MDN6350653.1 glycerophosphoryl diester phosphodiesterase membrane domain-containing protein [Yaniella sp.]MDN6356783.1 glycerophosphoryl diester phosphodiesterase membrane domain-containing protein [Yaniella sp.]